MPSTLAEIERREPQIQPDRTAELARSAATNGYGVVICGAGLSAALPGVVAAHTCLPVIGVPLSAALGGLDALLSTVQMPPGIPVATVSIGTWGARNAALLAAEILALKHDDVRVAYEDYRRGLASG